MTTALKPRIYAILLNIPKGLKIPRGNTRTGSSPVSGTRIKALRSSCDLRAFLGYLSTNFFRNQDQLLVLQAFQYACLTSVHSCIFSSEN